MNETCNYLFVYGTLLHGDNYYAEYLSANASVFSKGKFAGKLFDIGDYPGALYNPESFDYVNGTIFKMNDPIAVLKLLDGYEGFGDGQPQPNEFIRTRLLIDIKRTQMECEVYLYNLPVDGLKVVSSGDYLNR